MKKSKAGFTLIELMVAVALGMTLLGMVTYTLNNASKAANNATILANFNNRARAINGRLICELEAMQTAASNYLTGGSDIWFMTSAPYLLPPGETTENTHDLCWVRYELDSSSNTLYRYLYPDNDSPTAPTWTDPAVKKMPLDYNITAFNVSKGSVTATVTYTLTEDATLTTKEFECVAYLPGN